jgi:UDP-2-acetamido-2-deoxy-ribo-hexuluronate aminotransferase
MKFIDLGKQYQIIESQIDQRIKKVLQHGQFIIGPEVQELETELAQFVGVKHCITVSDGTVALLLAMMALELKPGDEIITTAFTFFATVETMLLLGLKPVFVDIDPRTYNIDANHIEAAITPNTKAIMPVSLYGQMADMDTINAIAKKHGLVVIEDAAQSFGATDEGRQSCSLSDLACTSFFPAKPLGCYGDGGAVFTNDDHLAKTLFELRVHGQSGRYIHTRLGINGRFDTLQAAILLEKLKIFPEEVKKRAMIGAYYSELLKDHVTVPYLAPGHTSVFAQYTIRVSDRDVFCQTLQKAGVPTAVHYPVPLTQQPILQDMAYAQVHLPHTERAAREVVSLPMHPYLSWEEIQRISRVVIDCVLEPVAA